MAITGMKSSPKSAQATKNYVAQYKKVMDDVVAACGGDDDKANQMIDELNEEYKKLPWVGQEIKPAKVAKCGVVGAGIMGGGIAQLLSFYDIPSRLKDINYDAIRLALKTAKSVFDYAIKKRILREHQVEYKFGLISPSVTYRGFETVDFVIEAVVEDLKIKQKVFNELGKIVPKDSVLASNTSSLPIKDISERE